MLRILVILGSCALLVLGQEEPEPPVQLGDRSQENADETDLEILIDKLEKRSGDVDSSGMSTPDEPAEENNKDKSLFEGDLVLSPHQKEIIDQETVDNGHLQKRKFLNIARKWPNKIVKFSPLSGTTRWKQAIQAGMRHIEANTCIRFQQSNSGPRLNFKVAGGCFSSLGMINNANGQTVSIGNGCERLGTVVHEILHAMGMLHEQSRPDRDNHVTIHWDNIVNGFERNFKKYSFSEVNTARIPYDVTSVMHYGPRGFAKDRSRNTITAKDSSKAHLMGQRSGLAKVDIDIVSAMYGCSDTGVTSKPTTRPPVTSKPTTSPPTGDCKDIFRFCHVYIQRGYCKSTHSRYNLMKEKCKKTCNFCNGNGGGGGTTSRPVTTRPPITGDCRNIWRFCTNYKARGWCSTSSSRFNQMTKYCRKTCDLCNGSPTPTSGTSCVDTMSDCRSRQARRQCRNSSANRYYRQMTTSCRKTCGFCSGMCQDLDLTRLCNSWKNRGYCTSRFVSYMTKNCEKTCGKC